MPRRSAGAERSSAVLIVDGPLEPDAEVDAIGGDRLKVRLSGRVREPAGPPRERVRALKGRRRSEGAVDIGTEQVAVGSGEGAVRIGRRVLPVARSNVLIH